MKRPSHHFAFESKPTFTSQSKKKKKYSSSSSSPPTKKNQTNHKKTSFHTILIQIAWIKITNHHHQHQPNDTIMTWSNEQTNGQTIKIHTHHTHTHTYANTPDSHQSINPSDQSYQKHSQLVRTLVRQSRPGDHNSLHYITPIFAQNRSRLTSSTQYSTIRPRSAYPHQHSTDSVAAIMGSPYYRDMDEPTSPAGGAHHRSRSASRPPISHTMDYPSKCSELIRFSFLPLTITTTTVHSFIHSVSSPTGTRYQSLDRGGLVDVHDREFIPIREPRDRSRDRSLERGLYLEDELYGRSARQSPNPLNMAAADRGYMSDLQHQQTDLQRELGNLKRELELTNQKLGSSMHSIKTFWSPELKKERALRKEESAKYSLINDQLKLLNSENQVRTLASICWRLFGFLGTCWFHFFSFSLFVSTETSNVGPSTWRRA